MIGLSLFEHFQKQFVSSLLVSVALIFCFCSASGAQTLKVSMIEKTPDQLVAAEVLREIYHRLGISLEFIVFPGKRALVESSKGNVDAELQRIFEIGESYPTLIRVPTPFMTWGVSVFSNKHDFKVDGWSSMRGFTVVMIRGMKYAEIGLENAGAKEIIVLNDIKSMLNLINSHRADLAISSHFNVTYHLKKMNIDSIHPLKPQLKRYELFHYLHEKNKHLVSQLDGVIRTMIKSGELERLQEKHKEGVLNF
ncbi:substrate-binding periplasmic protein [Litoribacillus peritrichatus]|uniref:substrate-binding periplasmic protein n=1 Tax=Litoribacillus peritrichatus TaxID=718191 RepID=UPI0031D8CC87